LPELVREAPVPVLVGGPASQPYAAAIEAAGAAVLGDDVSCALVRIERLLGAARPAPS
jgi:hypothetical protein